jgi:mutator protein MutT
MSQKHQVHVASYVIFRRDDKILLMRRANTGYEDGKYSLPSGHIEAGEFPDAAAIREAQEEVGVTIQDLVFKLVMYSDDNYVCFFFEATRWEGEIRNCEENKCDDLNWFDLNNLPKNIAPEVKTGLENFLQKRYYSNQKIKQS